MVELRKYPRYKIYTPAEAETFQLSIPVAVTEISATGLRLHSSKSIPPDTHIAVFINLGRQITFHGQVMWVIDEIKLSGHSYQSGIETDAIIDYGQEITEIVQREKLVQEIILLTKTG
jgi:hypothetical protein